MSGTSGNSSRRQAPLFAAAASKHSRELSIPRLAFLSLASWVVIAGVVAKNGIREAGLGKELAMYVGAPLFVVGWILVAFELARVKNGHVAEQVVIALSSLAILVSAAGSSMYMSEGERPPMALPIVFGVAWLVLGVLSGNTPLGRFAGLIGAAVIIVAMVVLMPLQRERGVVDGPGMPLFAIGWSVIAFAHALVMKS